MNADQKKWPDLAGRIEGNTHILPVRIYFEDTDCGGVVYHANFLKFCERARSDFIRLLGIDANGLANPQNGEPSIFVVRHVEIDYFKPGRMDDLLEVVTTCAEIGSASLKLRQDVMRDSVKIVSALVTVVLVGRSGKPQRLGALVRNAFQRFVNQARET
ncbi:MAG TPA: YbgC/FadM family acyl-CoA thioesterase [Methyloceanibacter sp.]|nr:YbgC/FadM family acyl-CoA thioesterase [Methyloceanibacter sp.]